MFQMNSDELLQSKHTIQSHSVKIQLSISGVDFMYQIVKV